MNSFYKRLPVLVVFFSILLSRSICSEQSYGSHVVFLVFTNESSSRGCINDKFHSDFSHDNTRSDFRGHGISIGANNFEKYTPQDFQHYYAQSGYTETEILHQRCLYMDDAFVKYAQTYSGYNGAIQKFHSELKNLSIIQFVSLPWPKLFMRDRIYIEILPLSNMLLPA
jgi:hypothetical protein